MKDRLKDWILCHERFYWYIVVGLAVLAFGIMTALGCAKLQRVEAAEEELSVYEAYQIACDYVSNDLGKDLSQYPYHLVHKAGKTYFTILFDDTKIYLTDYNNPDYPYDFYGTPDLLIRVYLDRTISNGTGGRSCISSFNDIKWSNHTIYYGIDLAHAEDGPLEPPTIEYKYNVSAPYIDNVKVSINNVLPKDYKTTDIEQSEWVVNYDIISPWFTGTDYKLVNKYYVWLPTKDYFDKLYAGWYFPLDVENGMTIKDLDLHTLKSDITAFQKNVGKSDRGICYTFLKEESVSNGRVKYDYRDFLESIQEASGHEDVNGEWVDFSFAEYYGFKETDSEWLNLYRPVLMSFLYVSRMDSLLYCSVEDNNYYGPYMVFDFLPEKFEGVTTKIEVDPLNTENLNSIIETGRLESLKNEMYNVAGENDSLSNQLGSIDLTLGAFGNGLSGSDLWTGFSSLSAGLASLVPSITSVAFLIGSVFSFLPVQLTTILAFTLLALCIIAIIKAIRG